MVFKYYTFLRRGCQLTAVIILSSMAVVSAAAQQTITISYEPSGNGYVISNAQFKVASGFRFQGITENTLGIWVEYVKDSGSVSGYKYEGKIYTHVPEWDGIWNYNEELTSIGSIRVEGTVMQAGKTVGSFADKLAYSDISPVSSSLVWNKEGFSKKINPKSLTVSGFTISSTQSPSLDNRLGNYISTPQRKKEDAGKKAEEERKKKEEQAKQNEKNEKEDSSDGDEGTSQIVIGDNFWANGGETQNTPTNNTGDDDFWTNGGKTENTVDRNKSNEKSSKDDFWENGGEVNEEKLTNSATPEDKEIVSQEEKLIKFHSTKDGYYVYGLKRKVSNEIILQANFPMIKKIGDYYFVETFDYVDISEPLFDKNSERRADRYDNAVTYVLNAEGEIILEGNFAYFGISRDEKGTMYYYTTTTLEYETGGCRGTFLYLIEKEQTYDANFRLINTKFINSCD